MKPMLKPASPEDAGTLCRSAAGHIAGRKGRSVVWGESNPPPAGVHDWLQYRAGWAC